MEILTICLCFFLSFGLSIYFVPVMRRAALKWGVVDRPDGHLKTQKEAVPYLGGIAIYMAFLLSISFVYEFSPQVLGLLLGGTVMLLIGLVDDFGVLAPYQKLAGQLLATFVLVKAGIYIKIAYFPIWVAIPLTFIWMVGIMNAVNIIDISDGLSSGVALVICLFLAAVAIINGNSTIATLTVALAGSLLGFLIFNFHPAKIYLGDAGSLFIGMMLGALAMIGDYSSQGNELGYIAPILFLGVPIFDTFFVMFIRAKKRIPVFLGSQDHYAIRFKRLGFSSRKVALISYLVAAILGGLAVLNMYLDETASMTIIGTLAIASLLFAWWLNRIEV